MTGAVPLHVRLRARLARAWGFARDFAAAAERHSLLTHAAAAAYFLFFSIPPLTLALVTLIGLIPIDRMVGTTASELLGYVQDLLGSFLPREAAAGLVYVLALRLRPLLLEIEEFGEVDLRARLQGLLEEVLPADAARSLGGIAADVLGNAHPGLLTLSFLGMLWGASAAIRATIRSMNVVYEARRGSFLTRSLRSITMTATILSGFTVALVLFPLLQGSILVVGTLFGLGSWMAWIGVGCGWLAQLGLVLSLVVVLQRMGPRVGQRVRDVFPGSVLTVLLWVALSVALAIWARFGWKNYNATYGALAGVILLLIWCYLAALALLLGAEFNAVRWRRRVARTRGGGASGAAVETSTTAT